MYLNFQFCVMALNKTLYYDNIQTIFVKADPFIPHNMSDHIWNAETVNMTIHNTDTRKSLFCASISPDMTISPSLLACFYIFVYIRIKFKDWKSYKVLWVAINFQTTVQLSFQHRRLLCLSEK